MLKCRSNARSGEEGSPGSPREPVALLDVNVSAAPDVEVAGMQLVKGQAVPVGQALHLQRAPAATAAAADCVSFLLNVIAGIFIALHYRCHSRPLARSRGGAACHVQPAGRADACACDWAAASQPEEPPAG